MCCAVIGHVRLPRNHGKMPELQQPLSPQSFHLLSTLDFGKRWRWRGRGCWALPLSFLLWLRKRQLRLSFIPLPLGLPLCQAFQRWMVVYHHKWRQLPAHNPDSSLVQASLGHYQDQKNELTFLFLCSSWLVLLIQAVCALSLFLRYNTHIRNWTHKQSFVLF